MDDGELEHQVEMAAALAEPMRRALYRFVVSRAPQEVSRDEAARAVGIQRGLAAFHLDRLAESRLLEPVYRRLSGRSGPGAGRPAKLYRRGGQVEISLPKREYELVARFLVEALAEHPEGASLDHVCSAARAFGRRLGQTASAAADGREARAVAAAVLDSRGFEPWVDEAGDLRLRNCPFVALASDFRTTVCTVNLALQEGLIEGLGAADLRAELSPDPPMCCVAIRARPRSEFPSTVR
jgi:predicted ArsR family transcriptional regulator